MQFHKTIGVLVALIGLALFVGVFFQDLKDFGSVAVLGVSGMGLMVLGMFVGSLD